VPTKKACEAFISRPLAGMSEAVSAQLHQSEINPVEYSSTHNQMKQLLIPTQFSPLA